MKLAIVICSTRPGRIGPVVADWTEQYRPIWEARFDAMEEILKTMKGENHE